MRGDAKDGLAITFINPIFSSEPIKPLPGLKAKEYPCAGSRQSLIIESSSGHTQKKYSMATMLRIANIASCMLRADLR